MGPVGDFLDTTIFGSTSIWTVLHDSSDLSDSRSAMMWYAMIIMNLRARQSGRQGTACQKLKKTPTTTAKTQQHQFEDARKTIEIDGII